MFYVIPSLILLHIIHIFFSFFLKKFWEDFFSHFLALVFSIETNVIVFPAFRGKTHHYGLKHWHSLPCSFWNTLPHSCHFGKNTSFNNSWQIFSQIINWFYTLVIHQHESYFISLALTSNLQSRTYIMACKKQHKNFFVSFLMCISITGSYTLSLFFIYIIM